MLLQLVEMLCKGTRITLALGCMRSKRARPTVELTCPPQTYMQRACIDLLRPSCRQTLKTCNLTLEVRQLQ
eukprot:4780545-Pleurochrysis_carterae.AAC.1